MTCQERKDLMLLYVTDGLDSSERDELRAHLAGGCPACAGALTEAQATVAQLPLALPRVPPPAGARDRLMQRILADAPVRRATVDEPQASGVRWPRIWAVAASIAAAIGIVAAVLNNIELKQERARHADVIAGKDHEIDELRTVSKASADALKLLQSTDLTALTLKKQDAQPNARGLVIWDRQAGKWHVSVFEMKPPPPGKVYELWFITPDKRTIAAGHIDIDATGRGTMTVEVPKDIGPVAAAAFTDEPAGSTMEKPAGTIQLLGEVQDKPI